MSDNMLVKIIMPSHTLFEEEARMVNIPGSDGMFGVLPRHVKLISTIQQGIVTIFVDGTEKRFFVYGGMAQITGDVVNIVTEFAVSLDDQSKADILNKIVELKMEIENSVKNSFEAGILDATLGKYNSLLKFVDN